MHMLDGLSVLDILTCIFILAVLILEAPLVWSLLRHGFDGTADRIVSNAVQEGYKQAIAELEAKRAGRH